MQRQQYTLSAKKNASRLTLGGLNIDNIRPNCGIKQGKGFGMEI
jgi:hypothetical protein